MKKITGAAFALLVMAGPAAAQGAPQPLHFAGVDAKKLSNGYRASKIIGASVYNDTNDGVGKVDDIITSPDARDSYVVISVGDFLGMGGKLVIVPFQSLKIADDKIILSGATKEALKALPEFQYAH